MRHKFSHRYDDAVDRLAPSRLRVWRPGDQLRVCARRLSSVMLQVLVAADGVVFDVASVGGFHPLSTPGGRNSSPVLTGGSETATCHG